MSILALRSGSVRPAAAKPQTPVMKPTWQERSLVFRMACGVVHVAHGWWYAKLAVHPALPKEANQALIVVTHMPSKVAILRLTEIDDAITAAEYLWERCRDAWNVEEMVDVTKIPADVVQWIKESNRLKGLAPR